MLETEARYGIPRGTMREDQVAATTKNFKKLWAVQRERRHAAETLARAHDEAEVFMSFSHSALEQHESASHSAHAVMSFLFL